MPPKMGKQKKARTAGSKKKKGVSRRQMADGNGALVKAPVSESRTRRGGQPQVSGSGNRIIVKHREFFLDVVGNASTAFSVSGLPVNPGIASIFPWLSVVAQQFEKYRFRSLVFEYEGRCASSNAGTVIVAVDFDASDGLPVTKGQVLSYRTFSADAPWKETSTRCPLADLCWEKYVRNGTVVGTDIKTYDLGTLDVCIQGCANNALGELYVSYEVELITPQVSPGLGGDVSAVANLTAALPLGPPAAVQVSGSLPFSVISNAGNSALLFSQAWEGLLLVVVGGTVITNFVIANVATYPVATLNPFNSPFTVNAAGTIALVGYQIRALPGSLVSLVATATTVTACSVLVASAPYVDL